MSNYEYYIRMLGSVAGHHKDSMITAYGITENPDGNPSKGIISIDGKTSAILDLLAMTVETAAEKLGIPVETLFLMLSNELEKRKDVNDEEIQGIT